MHIYNINKPIFEFSPDHPARRFLEAFIDCRRNCVGRELDGIDQEWFCNESLQLYRFSSFAYEWLSFDIELDGWISSARGATDAERRALEIIPKMRKLLVDCRQAAVADDNQEVICMCDQVLKMLELWKDSINYRLTC